jgi:excisionase family DNA binding protein
MFQVHLVKYEDSLANERQLMTLPEVAEYLGMAERTIYVWAQQAKIPAFKLGASWRFRRGEIDSWLDSQRSGPSTGRLNDPVEPKKSSFSQNRQDSAEQEALIEACMAFIESTLKQDDRDVWSVEQFVERFGEATTDEAIKRLSKRKKLRVTEKPGLNRDKVRVITRR